MNAPAARLSESGCVDPGDPRKPAAGLIPYDVASPLWSDGAEKDRFLALPDGARIKVKDCALEPGACADPGAGGTPQDDGHWELPVGTVLVKTFRFGSRLVETRLLVRFDEFTWKGYSYEWNEAQTDAVVLPDMLGGLKKPVSTGSGTVVWHFPSRAQCLQCHHTAAGISLGPTSAQMNREFRYPGGVTSNQVATLEHIGLFERPLSRPLPAALAAPLAPGPVSERARSYLHANCANCHRPLGSFEGIDLRHQVPFAQTGLCNAAPEKGEVGVPGSLRLVPGNAAKSLTSIRMHALGEGRMPQIGTSVVDQQGVALVDQWIAGIAACP